MKVLVTGSSGFIGYWVSKELLNNGYKVLSGLIITMIITILN